MELATGQGADDHGSEAHGRRYATTHRAGPDTFTWVFGQGMIGASAMFLVFGLGYVCCAGSKWYTQILSLTPKP